MPRPGNEAMPRLGNETMETHCPTRALLFLLIRNKATTPSRPAGGQRTNTHVTTV